MEFEHKNKWKIPIAICCITIFIIICYLIFKLLINNKVLKEDINSITIKYYPTYSVSVGKHYIDIVEITLSGEDFDKAAKLLKEVKEDKSFYMCACSITDEAEIIINNNYKITFGYNYGMAGYINQKNETVVGISNELYTLINEIIDKNNNKIFQTLTADTVSIEKDNKIVNITSEIDKTKLLNNLKFLKVNNNEDYLTYSPISYIINLDNNIKIYVYGSTGYLLNENENSYFVIFKSNDSTSIDEIYNKYIND